MYVKLESLYIFSLFIVAVSHNAACSVTDLEGGEEGYIASVMASYTACGSQHMPWIIQVLKNNTFSETYIMYID